MLWQRTQKQNGVSYEEDHKKGPSGESARYSIFEGGSFNWKIPKEQVWSDIQPRMEVHPPRKVVAFRSLTVLLSSAAVILVLLSLTFFARYYTTSVQIPAGQHRLAQLPDGSAIELNAESELSYHPWWWRFDRSLSFKGEGFFEVKPGRKFTVKSERGTTSVLGTSFNIFARDNTYRVTCVTGRVKVTSPRNETVILHPQTKAEIDENGLIRTINLSEPTTDISWKNYLFFFTAAPINEVLREIERQYGVKLKNNAVPLSLYTGNFRKEESVEEVLKVVCMPMGLDYRKISDLEYLIYQSN